jgi:hemerythrin-like domain-containing protein
MAAPGQDEVSNKRLRTTPSIAPAPEGLLDSPLDFLLAEHFRQREAALLLALIADGIINKETMRSVRKFLLTDLEEHTLDENLVFFPALRRHCRPEDDIERLIDVLVREHESDRLLGAQAADVIAKLVEEEAPTEFERGRLRVFAEHLRGHIALENGVLLPIARARLEVADLAALARELKARRAGRRLHT